MDDKQIKSDDKQDDVAEQVIEKTTPLEEYKKARKQNNGKYMKLFLFVFIQIGLCFGLFTFSYQNDLNYRVFKHIEYNLTGKIHLKTGTYTGEVDFGYLTGKGIFNYKSSSTYNGEFLNNELSGIGKLNIPSKGEYVGSFEESQKKGKGVFTWTDGSTYEGHWSNDALNGEGIYTDEDGISLIGTFQNNKIKSGTCDFENKTGKYHLKFEDFEIENAQIEFSDGTEYIGKASASAIEGEGKMTFANGDTYEGSFTDGKRSGNGKYTWVNGDYYEGNWNSDQMSGTGIYHFENGSSMSGEFLENSFENGTIIIINSNGKYTFEYKDQELLNVVMELKNGTYYSGTITDGKLTGDAEIKYSNGDTYEGKVIDGNKSGSGIYYWDSGAWYEGSWENDQMNGKGTYRYSSKEPGYKIIGNFLNSAPNGECQYYVNSSDAYKTDWANGKCVKIYE